jgi:hypothetical protein
MFCGANSCLCGVGSAQALFVGQSVLSCDGRFTLLMASNGDLILEWTAGPTLWDSGTGAANNGGAYLDMLAGGNLVIYGNCLAPNNICWSTATDANPGAFVVVQDDGNLVVYSAGGVQLWSSGTGGH